MLAPENNCTATPSVADEAGAVSSETSGTNELAARPTPRADELASTLM
jgi:hypothetical protein